jgi:hypothetical protein
VKRQEIWEGGGVADQVPLGKELMDFQDVMVLVEIGS